MFKFALMRVAQSLEVKNNTGANKSEKTLQDKLMSY